MKTYLLVALVLLSGCSWFHRKAPAPDPTELIVTGAPAGSLLVVDDVPVGHPAEAANRTQILRVATGSHVLEVKVGDAVIYREHVYLDAGEKRVITVLSGFNPQ